MLSIQNTVISDDIFENKFVCHLEHCLGTCCVMGDAGAPLEEAETEQLEMHYRSFEPFMTPAGIAAVAKLGTFDLDAGGDYVTPLVGREECAYAYFENGIAKCAIEKAYHQGVIPFQKPISCHLYPVRLSRYHNFTAVNVHQWQVCATAFEQGEALGVPLYKFLKVPLIRRFGQEWYEELLATVAYCQKGNTALKKDNH